MAHILGKPAIGMTVTLELTEQEAGALDALLGYDADAFLRAFYKEMGRGYLQPYEDGLRSLFKNRGVLSSWLSRLAKARHAFNEV